MSWFTGLGKYTKAIVAGAASVGVILVTLAANPNITTVVPQTVAQWAAAAGSVIVTVIAVFASPKNT